MLPPRPPCRRRRPFERGRRQAQRGDVGGGREAAALSIVGEMTEVHVGKVQFGASRRVEPQADAFAGEGVTDVIVAAFVREVAGAGDDFDLLVSGIDQRFVALAEAPGAGLVKIRRRLLVERLVRPVVIIGVTPALEAALLRGEIGRGGLDRLRFQVAVHALVRAVFLRRGRSHELHFDTLFDPPQTQTREAAQPVGGERRTQIAANDFGQAVVAHQRAKGLQRALELLVGPRRAGEQVVAVAVADRQGIAALSVAERKPALEIHGPDVVRLRRHRQPVVAGHKGPGAAPAPHALAVAPQDLGNCAARWWLLDGVFARQHRLQFLRAPRAMQPALRENECLDRFVGALRRVVRPVAARLQARQTECGVALQMFVAGLATDAELFAQLGHGKAPATGEYNESIDLFHIGYVGPGHRPMCNLSPRIKCHLSRRIEPAVTCIRPGGYAVFQESIRDPLGSARRAEEGIRDRLGLTEQQRVGCFIHPMSYELAKVTISRMILVLAVGVAVSMFCGCTHIAVTGRANKFDTGYGSPINSCLVVAYPKLSEVNITAGFSERRSQSFSKYLQERGIKTGVVEAKIDFSDDARGAAIKRGFPIFVTITLDKTGPGDGLYGTSTYIVTWYSVDSPQAIAEYEIRVDHASFDKTAASRLVNEGMYELMLDEARRLKRHGKS